MLYSCCTAVSSLLLLRVIAISSLVLLATFGNAAWIQSKRFYYVNMMIISTQMIVVTLLIFSWPSHVDLFHVGSCTIFHYTISMDITIFSSFLLLVLDLLILLSICYQYRLHFNQHGVHSTHSTYFTLVFYFAANGFFMSSDFISNALFYELQNIPFLAFLLLRPTQQNGSMYDIAQGSRKLVDGSDHSHTNVALKGQDQAILFLLWYALSSGVCLYIGYYILYAQCSTSSIYLIKSNIGTGTCLNDHQNINLILNRDLSDTVHGTIRSANSSLWFIHIALWLIFCSGAVKVALVPFHIWLSKVHVEASTVGSVLLAGVALKSGFYLHILFWFPSYFHTRTHSLTSTREIETSGSVTDLFLFFFLLGSIVISLSLFYQVDSKRWIALYSIAHMQNFYYFLLCSNDRLLELSIFYGMLGHSFISGGLFFMVGYIVDTTANRNVKEISSYLSATTKVFFFLLIVSNAAFPFLGLFVTEVVNFTYFIQQYYWTTLLFILLSSSCFLSGMYILAKIQYAGTFAAPQANVQTFNQSDSIVVMVVAPIILISFLMGFQWVLPISLLQYQDFSL